MIEDILPLSRIRIEILTELIIEPLMAKEISDKIKKSLQSTYNFLSDMNKILEKKQKIYSIKHEVKILLSDFLIRNLLEKRLGKYYDILPYIKKHIDPSEMIFFGSFFRRDYDENSDIDIYIISEKKSSFVKKVESNLSKALKRKIQIIEVHPKIHLTEKDKFSNLYNSILKDPKQGIKVPLKII